MVHKTHNDRLDYRPEQLFILTDGIYSFVKNFTQSDRYGTNKYLAKDLYLMQAKFGDLYS